MVRSIIKAAKILQFFLDQQRDLHFEEIYRFAGEKKGTLYHILQTLQHIGYVQRNQHGKYQLGIIFLSLGAVCRRNLPLFTIIHPIIEQLMEKANEIVFFGILSNFEIIHVDSFYPTVEHTLGVEIGARSPLYCTGLGKAVLAFLDPSQQKQFLEKVELEAFTNNTITDPDKLLVELKLTKERGYAIDNMEKNSRTFCFGAPVFQANNKVLGSVSLSGGDLMEKDKKEMVTILVNCANTISGLLGSSRKISANLSL
jgi:DNA-binding IclR family transcriptional regulator